MASKPSGAPSTRRSAAGSESVGTFLASLDHPLKQEILAIRQMILDADPSIAEAIKWNVPSFYTSEHFATMHLRPKDSVRVILHLGAKPRATATSGIAIADPESLLEWLGKDRASVTFRDLKDIHSKRAAFATLIRQWITHVD
jgi:hypothetical protein